MSRLVRRFGNVSLIVLIGLFPTLVVIASQGATARQARRGLVRAEGHAVADAGGAFNALGATLFWGAWGYKSDRPRLERNLAVLSDAGVDYVRVLGSVGGPSWEDREVDPRWNDHEEIIAGLTDLAYDRYGMRVQWTLFGGAPFTPAGSAREALVDRFARLAKGREHKIFAFEIANEARSNGFGGAQGISELRALGARLDRQTPVLVALSDPATGAECAVYAGATVDVATMHYERGFGGEGPWRPVRAPWDYPAQFDASCRRQLPPVVFNNEPIGPESSVQQDDDPARIAAAFALTFLSNHAAYVLHAGPGIRGGGRADVSGKLRRHGHFDELLSFAPIVHALKEVKRYLPPGLANWARHDPNSQSAPVHGSERAYAASSGPAFIVLVTEIDKTTVLRARERSSIDVRQIPTGKLLQHIEVSAGETLPLRADAAVMLIGTRASR